jgi:methionyl-tRNA formyltransferase
MSYKATTGPSRVLLVGCGPTAAGALESLAERFTVVGVVRECGPEATSTDPVIVRARQLGAVVLTTATIAALEAAIEQLEPDCVVVSSFHRIIPQSLLGRCRFVNVHYAMLPRYRGRANVNWALINGEAITGISIHEIAPGLDAGNILFQYAIEIGAEDTVADLYRCLDDVQRRALGETVERFLEGDPGKPQDEVHASYGCTRLPEDGQIDWSAPSIEIDRLVRALARPFPGAFTYLEQKRLTVWRAARLAYAPRYDGRIPGRVVNVERSEGFVDVLTGDGMLRVIEVQLEGEAVAPAATVIRSVKATLGLRSGALLKRIEQLEARVVALAQQLARTAGNGYGNRVGEGV